MVYRIEYRARAAADLRRLRAFDRRRLEDTVARQLTHEPTVETGNRFRMDPNSLAAWELRIDPFRMLYDVEGGVVRVIAVGRKIRERLYEDGKELDTRA